MKFKNLNRCFPDNKTGRSARQVATPWRNRVPCFIFLIFIKERPQICRLKFLKFLLQELCFVDASVNPVLFKELFMGTCFDDAALV